MKKTILVNLAMLISCVSAYSSNVSDTTQLKPKSIYGKEAKAVAAILDNNHYRKLNLNDSLSSVILDEYFKSLDNNKTYFLASDLSSFEKYRYEIDNLTRSENVSPAYEIYAVFRSRFVQRMDYVIKTLITQQFDYTTNEVYQSDRDKEPWCKNESELNEVWRKIIKSQALSLKLAGKPQPEIEKMLTERYARLKKSLSQYNTEDVFSMYMNTITESYDPHTNYFSPKAADLFKQSMSLSLEGIGARLQTENDYTKVAEIIAGGPADKSDLIHANDRIIGVAQGESGEMVDVIGWRIDEVVKLIKGPKGTKVRLLIFPSETGIAGPSQIITIVREKIKLEDQQATKKMIQYEENGKAMKLGVITLPTFYMDFDAYKNGDPNYTSTTRDVKRLITELQSEKMDGLVLDLRNNGGGSLAEAIDLTGLFIKDGPVVQVKSSGNKIEVGSDDDSSISYSGPLVVMTNRFSASASEIFAGAIQDYHRGVIVGESTYGKGTVQTVIDLNRFLPGQQEEVGQLKITFQKFYRVTGSSTQHKGVTPDILLPSALDAEQYGESSQPSALPWDEIRGTFYQKTPVINARVVSSLTKSYQTRLKTDPALEKYVVETEEIRKSINETTISLNETVRKEEMDEAEKKKLANDKLKAALGGVESDKSVEANKTSNFEKMDDEYLREGLFVLHDLILSKIG